MNKVITMDAMLNAMAEARSKLWALARKHYSPELGFVPVGKIVDLQHATVAQLLDDGQFKGDRLEKVNTAYAREFPFGEQVEAPKAPVKKVPEDAIVLTLAQFRDGGDYPWAVAEDEFGNNYFVGSIKREKLARLGVDDIDQQFVATVQPSERRNSEFKNEVKQVWSLE